jgi:predicted aconitase with swiveling domain
LVLRQTISIAGGLSLETGRIIDIHAPQQGALVAGQILVMPVGRGSSTSSTALAESLRLGTGPAAIILPGTDQILVMGSLIARMLYDVDCPIVVASEHDHAAIRTGDHVAIRADGSFRVDPRSGS